MKREYFWFILIAIIALSGCGNNSVHSTTEESTEMQTTHVVQEVIESGADPESGLNWQEILKKTTDYLPDKEKLQAELPENVNIRDWVQGDIGLDGKDDIVVIYQYPEEGEYSCLALKTAIFTKKSERYECTAFHETLLPDNMSGGTFGDPYSSTAIEEETGDIIFSIYGGSSDRWGHTLRFGMDGEELVQRECVEFTHNTFADGEITISYDYQNQKTECYAYWYEEEAQEVLLYSYKWKERVKAPKFLETESFFDIPDERLAPNVPLPGLYEFRVSTLARERGTNFSAEDILDESKDIYNSEMQKVMYDTEIVFVDNISRYLGYEIPAYYYEDEQGNQLHYYGVECDWDLEESEEIEWTHRLGVWDEENSYFRILEYPVGESR